MRFAGRSGASVLRRAAAPARESKRVMVGRNGCDKQQKY